MGAEVDGASPEAVTGIMTARVVDRQVPVYALRQCMLRWLTATIKWRTREGGRGGGFGEQHTVIYKRWRHCPATICCQWERERERAVFNSVKCYGSSNAQITNHRREFACAGVHDNTTKTGNSSHPNNTICVTDVRNIICYCKVGRPTGSVLQRFDCISECWWSVLYTHAYEGEGGREIEIKYWYRIGSNNNNGIVAVIVGNSCACTVRRIYTTH